MRATGASTVIGTFNSEQRFHSGGIRVIRTPVRAPNANAYAERWVGTVRRELLDRTLIWNQAHLQRILRAYEIQDDGKGFNVAEIRPSTHGLAGMKHRVEAAGGKLTVDSVEQAYVMVEPKQKLQRLAEVLAGRTHHHLMPARPNPEAIALHELVARAAAAGGFFSSQSNCTHHQRRFSSLSSSSSSRPESRWWKKTRWNWPGS